MKFGETGDSIYAYSFFVQEGYSTPAWPFDKAVKVLKAIDGTIIDTINFGAREHRTAEFNLNYMSKTDHYLIKTYFDANLGKKIRVEFENAGERVFGEIYNGTVYYAYLLQAKTMGEQMFSQGHQMYGFSMRLDYAGTSANSVPNPADESRYDFCIKLDCARVTSGCSQANKAALDAVIDKPGGSRGLTLDNRKIYFWNIAAWTVSGDNNNQVTAFEKITGREGNLDANRRMYFSLSAPSSGSSYLNIYKDSARTQLIGHTLTTSATGPVAVYQDNGSGLGGTLDWVAHTATDTDIYVQFGQWEFQYTLPANDAAQGLLNGVFRLSAFADISGASTGMGGFDYKSGWLVEKSVKFPRYSVDARQGPAIEHPEGFSFAIDNSAKRWKYPIDNNLAFYGAYCELYVYDRANGVLVLMRSGYNNRNKFDYTRLEFEIEPEIFMQNRSFPVTTVGKDNYPNANEKVKGKPVLATYGRWDKGQLQTIAFNMDPTRFPGGKKFIDVSNWDIPTKAMTLVLPASELTGLLGYDFKSYPLNTTKYLFVAIQVQPDQKDLKKLRKVLAIVESSGNTVLTLDAGFSDPVTKLAKVIVYLSNIQIVIDDEKCIGFREPDYLLAGASSLAKKPIELYTKEDSKLVKVQGSSFSLVENGKENELTVNTNKISIESTGSIVESECQELTFVNGTRVNDIVDKPGGAYNYFDFGFSPDGVESNEFKVTPALRINSWQTIVSQVGQREAEDHVRSTTYLGEGRFIAAYSKNFTTLVWNKFEGATGYRLTRRLIETISSSTTSRDRSQGPGTTRYDRGIDTAFGVVNGVKLKDNSIVYGSGGIVTISGSNPGVNDGDAFVAIDLSVSNTQALDYKYTLEPIANGQIQPSLESEIGRNRSVASGIQSLRAVGKNGSAVLVWPVPDNQAGFVISKDGVLGSSVINSTQGWYEATSLTNNQAYNFKVLINTLAIGTSGDKWTKPAGTTSNQGSHQLLKGGDAYSGNPFSVLTDLKYNILTLTDNTLAHALGSGIVAKRINNDGLDLPAAAVVFSWLWAINKDANSFGYLAGAKDVRVLGNFVVRSWKGSNTPVPFIIQLRGIKADKSVAFVIQYENMTAKTPPESGAYGAFARFENLRPSQSGNPANLNYDTDNVSPNADGLYTGKDMWKLPDYLFENEASEWNQVEYLMFSITNAEPIDYANVSGRDSLGYHLGLGGVPSQTWTQIINHRPNLYLEYTRQFDGGLSEPLYARIDGGKKDDAAGTITGTPYKIIEKARHVIDDVVNSMLGFKPTYLGKEMQSRDSWLWRWQTKESKSMLDTLQTLAKNIHGIFTLSPDGKLYLRTLDIDDKNAASVYTFTDSNIIVDSLGSPEYRRRNEIYQRFRLKYNIEPSKGGPTEEMLIGWDLATNSAILSGYETMVEDSSGRASPTGGDDSLAATHCRLSTQLYAAGLGVNEFGQAETNERIYEMFYRPTKAATLGPDPVERDLPNLSTLWGVGAIPPKNAMKALAAMIVKYFCLDSWYFPLSCSMKLAIYDSGVSGLKDEAGTRDYKIKLGDVVTVNSSFHTNGGPVRGIVLDIEPQFYDGTARLHVFCPRPPGQMGAFVDPIWDAGGPGARNEADFTFKGSLYGLIGEAGTFADAGAPGSRNEANMKFPDGTFADSKGQGSGKA